MESKEIILATRGVSAGAFGDSASEPSAVGICEGVLRGCAQKVQNRLSGRFCAEHFGHRTIDDGVIGIRRTLWIMGD